MRRVVPRLAVLIIACVAIAAGVPALSAATAQGRLAGLTQITYGCPGPQRIGQQCEHWSAFVNARFALTRDRADGRPIASTRRVVASDQHGRFNVQLATGTYSLTPLPQAHTRGGHTLTVMIHTGTVTRVTVRYLGYPMMA